MAHLGLVQYWKASPKTLVLRLFRVNNIALRKVSDSDHARAGDVDKCADPKKGYVIVARNVVSVNATLYFREQEDLD